MFFQLIVEKATANFDQTNRALTKHGGNVPLLGDPRVCRITLFSCSRVLRHKAFY
jgi:hypothetical protein